MPVGIRHRRRSVLEQLVAAGIAALTAGLAVVVLLGAGPFSAVVEPPRQPPLSKLGRTNPVSPGRERGAAPLRHAVPPPARVVPRPMRGARHTAQAPVLRSRPIVRPTAATTSVVVRPPVPAEPRARTTTEAASAPAVSLPPVPDVPAAPVTTTPAVSIPAQTTPVVTTPPVTVPTLPVLP